MKRTLLFGMTWALALLLITAGCKDDDNEVMISLEDLAVTVDENPETGYLLGTIVSDSSMPLTFSIVSQTPNGAININEETGALTVATPALFDFETNPVITATISAEEAQNTATVTITVNNVNELSVQDFSVTIDENPANGQSLGTVQASGEGTLAYSITSSAPASALTINATTGELTVADAALFDFESNPVITAEISVGNGGNIQTLTATINLNNVVELTLQDFSVTIDEN
ncbi:MAG: cadherin repeat domain-containing protein, partial [Cyclobacteriaceae bacterium]|nr:cadherin repeat domain-containing protein [Cyclobacteriaceae bacterium]